MWPRPVSLICFPASEPYLPAQAKKCSEHASGLGRSSARSCYLLSTCNYLLLNTLTKIGSQGDRANPSCICRAGCLGFKTMTCIQVAKGMMHEPTEFNTMLPIIPLVQKQSLKSPLIIQIHSDGNTTKVCLHSTVEYTPWNTPG